jgi:hypothetical protein
MSAPTGNILSVPIKLRANDIVRHIINIDSKFRDSPNVFSQSDFYFTLLSAVRNVLRIRITSVELPNNFFFFTEKRGNVSFRVTYDASGTLAVKDVVLPDGNYTSDGPDGDSMVLFLNNTFLSLASGFKLKVSFSIINGAFTFVGSGPFQIDTAIGTVDRLTDYGLGYYLGFTRDQHNSVADSSGNYMVISDKSANFNGENYVFLYLNDYVCVRQTIRSYDSTYSQVKSKPEEFNALAKIIITTPKNYIAFDDYANRQIKEVVFPNPVDLNRLRIKLLNAYGEVIDLCSAQFSFSMEVLEVKNMTLYNTIRDSLTLEYL